MTSGRRIGTDPKTCTHPASRRHVGRWNGDVCLDCATVIPKVRFAVWLTAERIGLSRANPEVLWWSFDKAEAETKAEQRGGKVVDLEWLLKHQDALRSGEVTL